MVINSFFSIFLDWTHSWFSTRSACWNFWLTSPASQLLVASCWLLARTGFQSRRFEKSDWSASRSHVPQTLMTFCTLWFETCRQSHLGLAGNSNYFFGSFQFHPLFDHECSLCIHPHFLTRCHLALTPCRISLVEPTFLTPYKQTWSN